jgi:hypothetical protein
MRVNRHAFYFRASVCVSNIEKLAKTLSKIHIAPRRPLPVYHQPFNGSQMEVPD